MPALCGTAQAVPITRAYEFVAVDLQAQNYEQGDFPVTDPVFGRARVTFDPMGPEVVDEREGILDFSINVSSASPIAFNYQPVLDILTFGGLGGGVNDADIADFMLRIGDASTMQPTFLYLSYNNRREYWIASSGTVTLIGVPEPGSPAMLALGLLALAFLCRIPDRRLTQRRVASSSLTLPVSTGRICGAMPKGLSTRFVSRDLCSIGSSARSLLSGLLFGRRRHSASTGIFR